MSEERYAAVAYRRYDLGDEVLLVGASAAAQRVPRRWAEWLERCTAFGALEQHARQLSDSYQYLTVEAIHHELRSMCAAGLLVPHSQVVADLKGPQTAREPATQIATTVFVTKDRPTLLRRGLHSVLGNLRASNRRTEALVVDGSLHPAVRTQVLDILRALRAESGFAVRYVGLDEKCSFIDALAREGCNPDLLRYALLPAPGPLGAYGANRNAVLLSTVGDAALSLDDDVVCRFVRHPQVRDGLEVAPVASEDFYFFPSREEGHPLHESDEDLIGLHERVLGRRLGDCLYDSAAAPVEIVRGVIPSLKPQSPVLLTRLGLRGDSGMRSPHWHLLLRGQSLARMTASRQAYDSAKHSRELLRVVRQVSLARGGSLLGFCMGLDNRRLLPPFIPVGRAEDSLFLSSLRHTHADMLVAHLPVAISHFPNELRTYPADVMRDGFARLSLIQLLQAALESYAPSQGPDATDNLRAVGALLSHLGGLHPAEFQRLIRDALLGRMGRWLQRLEAACHELPAERGYWRDDLDEQARGVRQLIERPDFPVFPGKDDLREEQGQFGRLGKLMSHWPDIVAAAIHLRRRGIPLGRSVRHG